MEIEDLIKMMTIKANFLELLRQPETITAIIMAT
jgi:hypothetical protein